MKFFDVKDLISYSDFMQIVDTRTFSNPIHAADSDIIHITEKDLDGVDASREDRFAANR